MDINETPPVILKPIRISVYKNELTGELWINKGTEGWNRIVSVKELNAAITTAVGNIAFPDPIEPEAPTIDPAVITAAVNAAMATKFKSLLYTAVDFPSVNGSNRGEMTLVYPGAMPGDLALIGGPNNFSNDELMTARITLPDTCKLVLYNFKTSTAYKLPVQDIRIHLIKQ